MYLNIINNTSFDSQRTKNQNEKHKKASENKEEETLNSLEIPEFRPFSSIFYGELTKDWLSLNT